MVQKTSYKSSLLGAVRCFAPSSIPRDHFKLFPANVARIYFPFHVRCSASFEYAAFDSRALNRLLGNPVS